MGESGTLSESEWIRLKTLIRLPQPNSRKLAESFIEPLDSYLSTLSFGESCIRRITRHCRRFLRYLRDAGASCVTRGDISSFFGQDTHKSEFIAKECRRDIIRFIEYMGETGLIEESEWERVKPVIRPPLPLLGGEDLERFAKLAKSGETEPLSRFGERCALLFRHLDEAHYTATPKKYAYSCAKSLRAFLEANGLPYSHAIALEWLELSKGECSHEQLTANRRVVMLIHDMAGADGSPEPKVLYAKGGAKPPGWGEGLLAEYMDEKKREGCGKSTLGTISSSCVRLMDYMDANGLRWETLTASAVKGFYASDEHKTPQGRNAYGSKIRGLLQYLAERGVVPDSLPLAVPSVSAPRVRIIKTLTKRQIDALYAYRASASTPEELRASAAIMLALTMGFRASDIAELKFSELSFNLSKITLVQRKTGRRISQPLTIEAGNSLWRYIHEGRPEYAGGDYVFARTMAPYGKVGTATIRKEVETALSAAGQDAAVFHSLRRTYASRLLSSGSDVSIVSAGLGHADTKTVERYLSTDEAGMRECPLGLDGIEYLGGFGL
jgi:site-specific recombinase XerD